MSNISIDTKQLSIDLMGVGIYVDKISIINSPDESPSQVCEILRGGKRRAYIYLTEDHTQETVLEQAIKSWQETDA